MPRMSLTRQTRFESAVTATDLDADPRMRAATSEEDPKGSTPVVYDTPKQHADRNCDEIPQGRP